MTEEVLTNPIIEGLFCQEEQAHLLQERKERRSVNWLEVFPEAKGYILAEAARIGTEIFEVKKEFGNHKVIIQTESTKDELIARSNFIYILYEDEVKRLALQLHILTTPVRKYLDTVYPVEYSRGFTAEQIQFARDVPLESVFEHDGQVLIRNGANFVTHCPFHSERTPSCVIYCEDNHFYCFGCNAKGNPIDYLITRHNLPFKDAVQSLIGGSYD